MGIEKIIEDLKAQGLADEEILNSLTQMVTEGKITEEDLAKAKELLSAGAQSDEEEEKKQAEQLFGLKF